MVLDITEIEFFFIVFELNKVEYFFSFSFLFRTKLLLISSSLCPQVLQDCTQSLLSLGLHFLLTGRMASPFISSSFPSFLPFTLLTTNHNKRNSLALTLLQPLPFSFSSPLGQIALIHQPLSFLLFLLSVSNKIG